MQQARDQALRIHLQLRQNPRHLHRVRYVWLPALPHLFTVCRSLAKCALTVQTRSQQRGHSAAPVPRGSRTPGRAPPAPSRAAPRAGSPAAAPVAATGTHLLSPPRAAPGRTAPTAELVKAWLGAPGNRSAATQTSCFQQLLDLLKSSARMPEGITESAATQSCWRQ